MSANIYDDLEHALAKGFEHIHLRAILFKSPSRVRARHVGRISVVVGVHLVAVYLANVTGVVTARR